MSQSKLLKKVMKLKVTGTSNTAQGRVKRVEEYAAQYVEDPYCAVSHRNGQAVKVLFCRFCRQMVSARSDRIQEHLKSDLHLSNKEVRAELGGMEGAIGHSPTGGPPGGGGATSSTEEEPVPEGEGQEFKVKWEEFNSNLGSMLSKQRSLEQFVDVTIWCEGKPIKCHQMVLAASSGYFGEMLKENPSSHPIFIINNLSFWVVEALVDYMYRGEVVVVSKDNLGELARAAKTLEVKGLEHLNPEDAEGLTLGSSVTSGHHDAGGNRDRGGSWDETATDRRVEAAVAIGIAREKGTRSVIETSPSTGSSARGLPPALVAVGSKQLSGNGSRPNGGVGYVPSCSPLKGLKVGLLGEDFQGVHLVATQGHFKVAARNGKPSHVGQLNVAGQEQDHPSSHNSGDCSQEQENGVGGQVQGASTDDNK